MSADAQTITANTLPISFACREAREDFRLTKDELQSMISGEDIVVARVAPAPQPKTTSADATTAPVASVAEDATSRPAAMPRVVVNSRSAPAITDTSFSETMTIAALCEMLKALDDPDVIVVSTAAVETAYINFSVDQHGCVGDDSRVNPHVQTLSLTPAMLAGCAAISFVGTKGLSARALIGVLGPCVEHYGDLRVCVNQARVVAGPPEKIALRTDSLLFKNDRQSMAEVQKVRKVIQVGEALVQSGEMDAARIAGTLSALMPRHWKQTCYLIDGTLVANVPEIYKRLPTIDKKSLAGLFVPNGPIAPVDDDRKHGTFVIMTLVPGLTFEALESAYGPNASKMSRLLAMAREATAKSSSA